MDTNYISWALLWFWNEAVQQGPYLSCWSEKAEEFVAKLPWNADNFRLGVNALKS